MIIEYLYRRFFNEPIDQKSYQPFSSNYIILEQKYCSPSLREFWIKFFINFDSSLSKKSSILIAIYKSVNRRDIEVFLDHNVKLKFWIWRFSIFSCLMRCYLLILTLPLKNFFHFFLEIGQDTSITYVSWLYSSVFI